MGYPRIASAVLKVMKKNPGKVMCASSIAHRLKCSTEGVTYVLRKHRGLGEPFLEGRRRQRITFTYSPSSGGPTKESKIKRLHYRQKLNGKPGELQYATLIGQAETIPSEIKITLPMLNGKGPIALSEARIIYEQLRSLFEK